MLRVGDGYGHVAGTLDRVAADTVLQTECLVSQALEHGFIPLVVEQIHVVAAHEGGVGDTSVPLRLGYDRLGNTAG